MGERRGSSQTRGGPTARGDGSGQDDASPDDPRLVAPVRRLPQRDETWECAARPARWWITPPGHPARRPAVLLTVAVAAARPVRVEIDDDPPSAPPLAGVAAPPPPPLPDQVWAHLLQAMRRPAGGAGPARRPTCIAVDRPALVAALAPRLAALEIACQERQTLPTLEAALRRLAARYDRRGPIPGLLTLPGVTVPLVARLCKLAAAYYRQAPWRTLTDHEPLEIRYPPDGPPRYAIVMGSGGAVFGLAVYDTLAQMRQLLAAADPEAVGRTIPQTALFFEEPIAMAFDDLEAMERFGLALAGPRAYPVFDRSTGAATLGPPSAADLFWLEGALAAVLVYLRDHLRVQGVAIRPAALTLPVATLAGERPVFLRLPVR